MSFNVGTIYATVKGDTHPLLKSLRSAKAEALGTAKSIGKEFNKTKIDIKNFVSAKTAVLAISAAAVATTIKVSQIGMGFETTMKTVQAVSRGSVEDFNRLSAAAREMGATTEWSATQSGEALKFLAMAGVDVDDSIRALPGLLDLATAGTMDLATAADLATDTTGAFQLGIEGLGRVSDAYAYTASSTNTSIAQMGEAFAESGAMATGFGYEIEEVSAFVGILANNMVKGGAAGTHIKNAILNNSKAAKALGLELDTKLIPTLEALNSSDMTDFEKQTFIFEKYGRIAGNSVAIMMANIDAIKAQETATRGAVGATQVQAAIMRDTAENMWKIFGSSLEEVSLQMYDTFSVDLKESLQVATSFVQDNADVFVDWGGKIASVAAVAFGALIVGAGLVSDAFNGWSMTWDVLKISFNVVMRELTGGLIFFSKKMHSVTSIFSDDIASNIEISIKSLEGAFNNFDNAVDESDKHMLNLGRTGSKTMNALESVFGDTSKKIVKISKWENAQVTKAIEKTSKTEKVLLGESVKANKKAAEDKEKAERALRAAMGKAADDYYEFENKELEKSKKAYETAGADKNKIDKWYNAEKTKLVDENLEDFFDSLDAETDANHKKNQQQIKADAQAAQEKENAIASMYSSMGNKADGYYDYQKNLLLKQSNDYVQLTGDQLAADAMYNDQYKALMREKTLASDDFFGGMKIGFEKSIEQQKTWAEVSEQIAMDYSTGATTALSENLFDIMHGDFNSIGEAWSSLWDTMLQTVIDKAAAMAIEWATVKVLEPALDFVMGAGSAALDVLGFEDGAWDLGKAVPDSKGRPGLPIVAHEGEMIIPEREASMLRSMMSDAGVTDFSGMQNVLTGEMSYNAAEEFIKKLGGTQAKRFLTGSASALLSSEASIGDVLRSVMSPQSMASAMLSAGITTTNEYAGMLTDKWGQFGQTIFGRIGGMVGGVPGSVVGGLVGGAAGMGIGDLFDARSYERFRDAGEDSMGWFSAQKEWREVFSRGTSIAGTNLYTDPSFQSFVDKEMGGDHDDHTRDRQDYGSYERESRPGGMGGYAKGGEVNKLYIPKGDDGIAGLKFGETVLTQQGTRNLNAIENGTFGTGGDRLSYEELKTMKRLLRLAQKWDADGLPQTRVA